jgi:hypothetical protein
MVVDAVCLELVSAKFPVKQGICREICKIRTLQSRDSVKNCRTSAGNAKIFRRDNREFSNGIRESEFHIREAQVGYQ